MVGRRGNAVAAIIVIVLLVAAAGIITYSRFSPPERIPQSQPVYSEMQNIIDRAFSKSSEQLLQNAFSNETNVWYCNKPLPPNTTEVGAGLAHYATAGLRNVDVEDFFTSPDEVDITQPLIVPEPNPSDIVLLNVTNLSITISSEDESRTVNLSIQTSAALKHQNIYNSLKEWMQCNAGNITQNIAAKMQQKPCQFESCCCGWFPMSGPAKDAILGRAGFTKEELDLVLNDSVKSLNNIFAGAQCGTRPFRTGNITCVVNRTGTNTITKVQNDLEIGYRENTCSNPSCEVRELWGDKGTPLEWSSAWDMAPAQKCPDRPALPVPTGLDPDIGEPDLDAEIPEDEVAKGYVMAVHKKAAADALITCRVFDENGLEETHFNLRIRVNMKNMCVMPPQRPAVVDTAVCVGGGGGACPCPSSPSCECESTPTRCDDLCRVIQVGECLPCPEPSTGPGPGTGSGPGTGTGVGPGDGDDTPDDDGEPASRPEPACGGGTFDDIGCGSTPST